MAGAVGTPPGRGGMMGAPWVVEVVEVVADVADVADMLALRFARALRRAGEGVRPE